MQLVKDVLRRLLVAPLMLLGWLAAAVVRAAWGRALFWHQGVPVVRLDSKSWPLNADKKWGGWYRGWGGTCFGHFIMLSDDADEFTLAHEMRHHEQHDANAVGGLIAALPVFPFEWWAGLMFWSCAPLFAYLGALAIAWLRGENAYRGNHLEEAAYDAVDEKR
jgi:hypothetical protein